MKGDERAMRVAVVADAVVNGADGRVLDALVDGDWGLVQLAPAALGDDPAAAWRTAALDQVDELRRHGARVIAVLTSADGREHEALRASGTDVLVAAADREPDATIVAIREAGS